MAVQLIRTSKLSYNIFGDPLVLLSDHRVVPTTFTLDVAKSGLCGVQVGIPMTKDGLGTSSSSNCHFLLVGFIEDNATALANNAPNLVNLINSEST